MSRHSSFGPEWERVRLEVLERDRWICASCGVDLMTLTEYNRTADHIVPASQGGPDEAWNLRAMCRSCNGKRQDKELHRQTFVNPRWLEAA